MKNFYNQIIFLHKPNDETTFGGITMVDERNKMALSSICENTIDLPLTVMDYRVNHLVKYYRIIKTIFKNYGNDDLDIIAKYLKKNDNTLIFISHSSFGSLVKRIKKEFPAVKVAVYYHNIEITMAYNRLIKQHQPGCIFEILRDYRSERLNVKYADYIYLLNERDGALLNKYYGNRTFYIHPMTLPDRFTEQMSKKENETAKLKLLFVGTYFWGNIPGLKKFIYEVIPFVDVDMYIVGKWMDRLLHEIRVPESVHIIGMVNSKELDEYYIGCDIVIAPILSGGGMKTKVAEAMMFGKPIVGTSEAFRGYDVNPSKLGVCSDNTNDYVRFIIDVDRHRSKLKDLGKYSRKCYEEKYSLGCSIKLFKESLL